MVKNVTLGAANCIKGKKGNSEARLMPNQTDDSNILLLLITNVLNDKINRTPIHKLRPKSPTPT